MNRFLIAIVLSLVAMVQARAQYDLYVEVSQAGTLEEEVTQILEDAKYDISSMKVFGPINGKDMMFIRDLCGVKGFSEPTEGKLKVLDLENADIVDSSEPYMNLHGRDLYSQLGRFGTCFLYNCKTLEHVMLPAYLEGIDSLAFANCKNLQNLDIPNTVESIGYGACVGCDNIVSIKVPDGVIEIGVGAFQQMARLKELTLGDGIEEIDNSLIMYDDSLQVINLGRKFKTFNPVVFYTAKALNELFVEADNPYYSSQDGILYTAEKDTLVTFPPALDMEEFTMYPDLRNVAPYAFSNARFLQKVTCSLNLEGIDSLAFFGCTALKEVNLNDLLKHIGFGAFGMPVGEESALEQLFIPASVSDIEGGAFILNTSLQSIQVDEENPYYVADERGTLFSKDLKRLCFVPTMAEEVRLPETLEEVGAYAFAGATGMASISIPDHVKAIGDGAFAYAAGLNELFLGEGVEKVGDLVVDECIALENLYLFAPDIREENLQPYSFLDTSGAVMEQCMLHVLPGTAMNYLSKKGFYSEEFDAFFFKDIVEMDHPEGVADVKVDHDTQVKVFDAAGRRLENPTRGLNIITSPGHKTLKRFVR